MDSNNHTPDLPMMAQFAKDSVSRVTKSLKRLKASAKKAVRKHDREVANKFPQPEYKSSHPLNNTKEIALKYRQQAEKLRSQLALLAKRITAQDNEKNHETANLLKSALNSYSEAVSSALSAEAFGIERKNSAMIDFIHQCRNAGDRVVSAFSDAVGAIHAEAMKEIAAVVKSEQGPSIETDLITARRVAIIEQEAVIAIEKSFTQSEESYAENVHTALQSLTVVFEEATKKQEHDTDRGKLLLRRAVDRLNQMKQVSTIAHLAEDINSYMDLELQYLLVRGDLFRLAVSRTQEKIRSLLL